MAEVTYPKWDYRSGPTLRTIAGYLPRRLGRRPAGRSGSDDEELIRRVRRQFEGVAAATRDAEGADRRPDLDLDAVVRARTDIRAGGPGSDRIT